MYWFSRWSLRGEKQFSQSHKENENYSLGLLLLMGHMTVQKQFSERGLVLLHQIHLWNYNQNFYCQADLKYFCLLRMPLNYCSFTGIWIYVKLAYVCLTDKLFKSGSFWINRQKGKMFILQLAKVWKSEYSIQRQHKVWIVKRNPSSTYFYQQWPYQTFINFSRFKFRST